MQNAPCRNPRAKTAVVHPVLIPHLKVVQERLGHSIVSLTLDTYSHAVPTLGREAADALIGG